MPYLVAQILLCLATAYGLGVVTGWLLYRSTHRSTEGIEPLARSAAPAMDKIAAAPAKVAETVPVSYAIEDIEGIGKGYGKRLRGLGIETTQELFQWGSSVAGRHSLAEHVGVEDFVIRQWVSMADLMRIDGVRSQFSELLEASGVSSTQDLAGQSADALTVKMAEVNSRERRTRTVPSSETVAGWIQQAKSLDQVV